MENWRCQFGTSNQKISILWHIIYSSYLISEDGYGAVAIITHIEKLSIGRYGHSAAVGLVPHQDWIYLDCAWICIDHSIVGCPDD